MSDRDATYDLLATNWDRPPMTPERGRLYVEYLRDVNDTEFHAAVEALVVICETWRPDVARIRRQVVEARGLFPSEAEAADTGRQYIEVRKLYEGGGTLGNKIPAPIVHPVVRDAALAGGIDHAASFTKAYREAVAAAVSGIQAGDLSQPVIFTPVRVGHRRPPALLWARNPATGEIGWHSPTGELVHRDTGDHRPGQLPAGAAPLALPFETTSP